ncbi:MAG: asparagine synthase (glutamine-hydrolyzing), partial [Verrucomicrobia bacterium]|nr:asparagine synthase (glutamine-hydrolyzing) [Verrucomicrobiota bacterium]
MRLAPGLPDFEPEAMLTALIGRLQHRGPDDDGILWQAPCGLAHRRLSIIDTTRAGRQPMGNDDATWQLVYNGEIYNYADLRQSFALDSQGYTFKSQTDTEVLLYLLESMGAECLQHLNGMYAFAAWDRQTRTLHLARDPFGIKPLFYTIHQQTFWFASEIKALLAIPGFDPAPSMEALHHYMSLAYIPGSLTAFEGIHELRPGHRIYIRPGDSAPKLSRFHQLTYQPNDQLNERDAIAETERLLEEAVRRHLIADVPVGVMLSGGLDSSTLAVLMQHCRQNAGFDTYSLAFDEPSFDESSYAQQVAQQIGSRHHIIRVTPKKVAELMPTYLGAIDEPYADGSAIPTWLLAQEAANDVSVLLSGEGGDECFAGYDTHAAYQARGLYRQLLPRLIRQRIVRPLTDRLPISDRKLGLAFRAKRFAEAAEWDVARAHFYWRAVLTE